MALTKIPVNHSAEAFELFLFAENNEQIYRQSLLPAYCNLDRKINAGKYDHEKAAKLFEYVAEFAAKLYVKRFCSDPWYKIFNPAARHEAAILLRDSYEADREIMKAK